MSKKETTGTNLSEDDIVNLLATLRVEPHPEANFEDRFVHDFRDRVARYAVTRPARKVLWEHILLRLTGMGKLKWACGATTLGLGALVAGFFSWPSGDVQNQNRVAPSIGSAVIASVDTPDVCSPRSVVVSSSLELESSTCIVPDQSFFLAGGDKLYSCQSVQRAEISESEKELHSMRPESVSYPASMLPHVVRPRQITLPVIDSGTTTVPSVF